MSSRKWDLDVTLQSNRHQDHQKSTELTEHGSFFDLSNSKSRAEQLEKSLNENASKAGVSHKENGEKELNRSVPSFAGLLRQMRLDPGLDTFTV